MDLYTKDTGTEKVQNHSSAGKTAASWMHEAREV